MKPISPHTLDEWIFEYLEGNLSLPEQGELETYISRNPEAQEEFASWKATYLKPQVAGYAGRQSLLRPAVPGWGWAVGIALLFLAGGLSLPFIMQTPSTEISEPLQVEEQPVENSAIPESAEEEDEQGLEFESGLSPKEVKKKIPKNLQPNQRVPESVPSAALKPNLESPLNVPPVVETPSAAAEPDAETFTKEKPSNQNPNLEPEFQPDREPELQPKSDSIATSKYGNLPPSVKVAGKSSKRIWNRRRRPGRNKPPKRRTRKTNQATPIDGDAF